MSSNQRRVTLAALWRIGLVFGLFLAVYRPAKVASAPLTTTASSIQFSSSAYRVDESAGTLTIPVTLDTISSLPVTVNFATLNGNAEAGVDYNSASGLLTFPAAVTDGYILNARDFTGLVVTEDPNDRHSAFTWRGEGSETHLYANASGAVTSVTTNIFPEISTTAQVSANTYEVWILQYGGDGDRSLDVTVGDGSFVHTSVTSGAGAQWVHVGTYSLQPTTIIKVKAAGAFENHGQGYPERRAAFVAIYLTTQPGSTPPSFVTNGQTSCPCVNAGLLATCPELTTQSITVGIADDTQIEAYETFTINLSTPQNGTLGTPSSTTVTIVGPSILSYLPFTAKGTAP